MSFNPSMPPFYANVPAIGLPFGTVIAPGGRIAAYVRATAKNDDPPFIQENRVASINEACKRVRSGRPDVIVVLDGHTETHSVSGAIWPNLKAGTVILGAGRPGSSNAPRVTLAHAGASVALNVADVVVMGLDFRGSTATMTAAFVITAAGCVFSKNRILMTGAFGANPPVAITGAADLQFNDNLIVADSTDPVVEITGAGTTNLEMHGNRIRQAQATSGGDCVNVANTAGISGFISDNRLKSAVAGTPGTSIGVVVGAGASPTLFQGENYDVDDAVTAAVVSTGS